MLAEFQHVLFSIAWAEREIREREWEIEIWFSGPYAILKLVIHFHPGLK